MGEGGYRVIYKGEILEGFEKQAVLREVAGILAIDEQAAARLINGERRVLGKGLDEPTARGRCMQLKRAGLRMALGVPQNGQGGAAGRAPDPSIGAKASSPAASRPRTRPVASAASEPLSAEQPERAVGLPSRVPFEFSGSGSEYFRIWIVNILLTIMTIGIYSAWAKVRNRSYFYGNTRVHGAAFEYLASPEADSEGSGDRRRGSDRLQPSLRLPTLRGGGFPGGVHLRFPLAGHACARLQRPPQRLAEHPLRVHQHLQGGLQGLHALAGARHADTGGILAPYAFYRQRRYLVENSSFGQTRFTFQATGRDYYRIFMLLSLWTIAVVALFVVAAMVFMPLAILALPIYLCGFAFFTVKTGNLFYNASRLGGTGWPP
jgi:hypothetical protein